MKCRLKERLLWNREVFPLHSQLFLRELVFDMAKPLFRRLAVRHGVGCFHAALVLLGVLWCASADLGGDRVARAPGVVGSRARSGCQRGPDRRPPRAGNLCLRGGMLIYKDVGGYCRSATVRTCTSGPPRIRRAGPCGMRAAHAPCACVFFCRAWCSCRQCRAMRCSRTRSRSR